MLTKIKTIGVGGAGGNALSRMMSRKIRGVEMIAINTDEQDLKKVRVHKTLRIGRKLTEGLGAGMNPEIGRLAAEENKDEISQIIQGTDMLFITCGLGGGTGSGAAPVVAELAKNQGILTIGVVTKPFSFEGLQRMRIANAALEKLREKVDALLVIPNDRIISLVGQDTTLMSAFLACDDILHQAVQGISDLILVPGIINVDFADVKSIMQKAGSAILGVGKSKGERKVENAVLQAINSPLLEFSIDGARRVLFNVSGGSGLSLADVDQAAKIITKTADKEAKIIFGATKDSKLNEDEIKITVIAACLPENR
ncbi:MAG: cell division protein FtsZ [Candidatus Nealsonbacteria bacterium]|nr:cell division protein FtsZ [Candidatus Nealsonbacteria bacterium]